MQQTKTSSIIDVGANLRARTLCRKYLIGSLASLLLFALSFTLISTLISEASAAQDVTVGANWVATSLTLDPDYGNGSMSDAGHGDIAFGDIIPTSTADGNIGTERVIKKTIGIESSGKYYSIYLSMANDSSALKLNGDDTNIRINPVAGTWDSPSAFSATSWGYAVPNTPVPTSASTWQESSTPEYPTFSQATTFSDTSNLGIDLTKNNHGSIYNQDTWVAAPVLGSAQQIWKAETTNNYGFGGENGDNINNHFDIYYGIMVGSDTLAGTYENQLIYTALASAQAIDEISHNLLVSERFVASGTTQTLKFDLASSESGLIKPGQVYAYVVPHSDATPNTITGEQEGETRLETDEEVLIRLQNNLAQNSSYYDACSFNQTDSSTDIVFDTDGITITCSMPAETPVWDGGLTNSATATDGYYDIWITIPSYNANYISKTTEVGTNNHVASIIYAGLQSVDENGDKFVTEMQEMTSSICSNTNQWGTALGKDARVYDYTGSGNALASTSYGSAAIGTGTFTLTDNRDDKTYLVRRLADGNCWMAQNLDLDLTAVANGDIALDNTNTDLNTKTSWTPTIYDDDVKPKYTNIDGNGFYNFYAATAGGALASDIAQDSICPTNWKLPESWTNGSFRSLIIWQYAVFPSNGTVDRDRSIMAKLQEVPLSYTLPGFYYFNTESITLVGERTALWTNGTMKDGRGCAFHLDPNYLHTANYADKEDFGVGIRCVARD